MAQKSETAKEVKDGAVAAGVGAGGSAVGSLIINPDKDKKDDKQSK